MSAAQENAVTDAQSQFEDWYVQNAFDYAANPIGSRDCGLMRRAWHAALAARQPGAQVPFGWWLQDANGVGYFSRKMQPAALYAHRTTPGYSATPLHAAPPAQGVDLGVLQAVSSEYNEWIIFHAAGNGDFDDFLRQRRHRDAAPGVGNG